MFVLSILFDHNNAHHFIIITWQSCASVSPPTHFNSHCKLIVCHFVLCSRNVDAQHIACCSNPIVIFRLMWTYESTIWRCLLIEYDWKTPFILFVCRFSDGVRFFAFNFFSYLFWPSAQFTFMQIQSFTAWIMSMTCNCILWSMRFREAIFFTQNSIVIFFHLLYTNAHIKNISIILQFAGAVFNQSTEYASDCIVRSIHTHTHT